MPCSLQGCWLHVAGQVALGICARFQATAAACDSIHIVACSCLPLLPHRAAAACFCCPIFLQLPRLPAHFAALWLLGAPQDEKTVRKLSERMPDVGRKVEYLLNTGNLSSRR